MEVDVAHEQDPHHSGQVGETPLPFELRFHDGEQQVGDENHPDLNFDGVGALAVEVAQGEVLLELLEPKNVIRVQTMYGKPKSSIVSQMPLNAFLMFRDLAK